MTDVIPADPGGPGVDPAVFRDVLGHYPTGVVVVTGSHPDGERLAFVIGTFTSVSLDPPLVAFLPMKSSETFARLRECPSMCVNILAGTQEDLGRTISGRRRDRLEGIPWSPSPSGDPVLDGSLAWLDVRLDRVVEAGDHWIVLCRVVDLAVTNPVAPLLFFQGGYGRFVVPTLVARAGALGGGGYRAAVDAAARVRDLLDDVACELGGECLLLASLDEDELVAVGSAVAPGIDSRELLSELIPVIPPVGDVAVADADEACRERWLAKAKGATEETIAALRDRLAFCREHGYLASFLPEGVDDAYDALHAASTAYAEGGGLTPAQEREVHRRLRESLVDYVMRPFEPDARYDIGALLVPVRTAGPPDARWNLTLRAAQLPRDATGSQVNGWVARLQRAAAEIAARLDG